MQEPLKDSNGVSIIPKRKPRCPNCRKQGTVVVDVTTPIPNGRWRQRHCRACGYEFTTTTSLLDNCEHCHQRTTYSCGRTTAERNGYYRVYRCKLCGKSTAIKETFPLPDEKRNENIRRAHDQKYY